jgi:hypothetical protein
MWFYFIMTFSTFVRGFHLTWLSKI